MMIAPFHQVELNFLIQLNMTKGERSCIKLSATIKETSSLFFPRYISILKNKPIGHEYKGNDVVSFGVNMPQCVWCFVFVRCNQPSLPR